MVRNQTLTFKPLSFPEYGRCGIKGDKNPGYR